MKTPAQIQTEIAALFPDNTTGIVTPATLRTVTNDLTDMQTSVANIGDLLTFVREKLTGPRTYYVSVAGNDANTGLVDSAGGAKLTWQAAYNLVASTLDFNGFLVTLKGATTKGTFPVGLVMTPAWVGGGGLIIDLFGSSIAETTTKGILNTVTQSGGISILNSFGGTRGKISSVGFAGVQNSGNCIMGIGQGIEFGTCFDAIMEVSQGGTLALAFPVWSSGTGGSALILAASEGTFGFNGQTINILSNQTFTVATIVADIGGAGIQANSAVIDLNPAASGGPFVITGPRFKVVGGSSIYTGGAGANFFPGTSAGIYAGGFYDGKLGVDTVFGGSATNSQLVLTSTNNATPSGDLLSLNASTFGFSGLVGNATATFGLAGFSLVTFGVIGTLGYAVGSGGAVTQGTSRTTGVTLNKASGAITLFSQVNSAVSAATAQSFTVTNSQVATTDTVICSQKSGTDLYEIFVTNVAAGSFKITTYSTGGTTNEAPVFNFAVLKAVST